MDTKRLIKSVLDFDPIAEAEEMVGGELTQDNFVVGLDFVQSKRGMLNRLMAETGDVSSDTGFHDYVRIASDFGFRLVYEERFPNYQRDNQPETFMVLWHDAGFLLALESYTWDSGVVHVNTARLYYNIQVPSARISDFWRECVSSGKFVRYTADTGGDENVWAGDHDVRDALKYHMGRLMEYTPLTKWVESPLLWLINFSESHVNEKAPWAERSREWDALCRRKINAMPAELRDMLLGCMKERA